MDILEPEQELNAAVAHALKLRRVDVDMTFAELADASGVTVRTLKRLLHGQSEIGMSEFARISRAMGREPDEILAAIRQQAENISK